MSEPLLDELLRRIVREEVRGAFEAGKGILAAGRAAYQFAAPLAAALL